MRSDAWSLLALAFVIALACVIAMTGCGIRSMNLQRAAIRGGSDLSVTATLDALDAATATAMVPKIAAACDVIDKTLAGDALTLSALVTAVKSKTPVEVHFLADALVTQIGADQGAVLLSADSVKYIRALSKGARQAAVCYDVADRKGE